MLFQGLARESLYYTQTTDWVKTFTPELDSEDGVIYLAWLKENVCLPVPFGAFILTHDQEVVGLANIVLDDDGAGEELGIDGIWLAGVMIRRECRGRGYGQMLMHRIDDYLAGKGRVNLFVSNPSARHIYEKFGFSDTGLKVSRVSKENRVLTKIYQESFSLEKVMQ